MKARMRWRGLKELRQQLRELAPELTEATDPLAQYAARGAADELRARYEARRRKGNLARGVKAYEGKHATPTRAIWRVTSWAPHALLFELGTRYAAPANLFIPITRQYRRAFYQSVGALLRTFNFRVYGEAE